MNVPAFEVVLPDEAARLLALARYDILRDLPPRAFERLTALTARLLRVPIAMINFVAEGATFTRACVGTDLTQHDRRLSFCALTLAHRDVLVLPDLQTDARFKDHPMVTPLGGARFYAGARTNGSCGSVRRKRTCSRRS